MDSDKGAKMNLKDLQKLVESFQMVSNEIYKDSIRELMKLPPDKQEQALIEFQKLYPDGFELLFGKTKD